MSKKKEQLLVDFESSIEKPNIAKIGGTKITILDKVFYAIDLHTDNLVVFNESQDYVGMVSGDSLDNVFNDNWDIINVEILPPS